MPGNSDAGQWNPSSAIGDTTAAAEIDSSGASLGTTRQGWLWNQDLTGLTLAADTAWSFQLRLRANQGTGTTARVCMRVTVVTGSAGAYTTVANLLTTRVTGATSTSAGQAGWRDQDARITVTSTAANFASTVGGSGTAAGHTFASGERLLVELGFCDANSTADRTWRLDFNTANSFVTTPDIALGTIAGTMAEVHAAQTADAAGTVVVSGSSAGSVAAQTDDIAGGPIVSGSVAGSTSAQTTDVAGGPIVSGSMAGAVSAQTTDMVGEVEQQSVTGVIAESHQAHTAHMAGGPIVSGISAASVSSQTGDMAGAVTDAPEVPPEPPPVRSNFLSNHAGHHGILVKVPHGRSGNLGRS